MPDQLSVVWCRNFTVIGVGSRGSRWSAKTPDLRPFAQAGLLAHLAGRHCGPLVLPAER